MSDSARLIEPGAEDDACPLVADLSENVAIFANNRMDARPKVSLLMVQEMADDNPNLVAVWESMCDGGGMHHFARNNTSPQGFTLCSGGCRPLCELL